MTARARAAVRGSRGRGRGARTRNSRWPGRERTGVEVVVVGKLPERRGGGGAARAARRESRSVGSRLVEPRQAQEPAGTVGEVRDVRCRIEATVEGEPAGFTRGSCISGRPREVAWAWQPSRLRRKGRPLRRDARRRRRRRRRRRVDGTPSLARGGRAAPRGRRPAWRAPRAASARARGRGATSPAAALTAATWLRAPRVGVRRRRAIHSQTVGSE